MVYFPPKPNTQPNSTTPLTTPVPNTEQIPAHGGKGGTITVVKKDPLPQKDFFAENEKNQPIDQKKQPADFWSKSVDGATILTPEQQKQQNDAILSDMVSQQLEKLIEDDSLYYPNPLNNFRQVTYHFRLFMTSETEVVTKVSTSPTVSELYKALDSLTQVTIAETGVTAGFNIKEVEMEQICGPGFRTRSNMTSSFKIVIVEPLGSSLMESISVAADNLDIQNFSKCWYYLELSFKGYDQSGNIIASPLSGENYPNGGRWIYKIAITNMEVHMDEGGATYTLQAIPYSVTAFDDDTCGRLPDNITVEGGTIKEFCDNLAKNLTDSWKERYQGEIYNFKINIDKITDYDKDPGSFKLKAGEEDPIYNLKLDDAGKNGTVAHLHEGQSISDIITFIYAHCEEAQKMMMDTNTAKELEDNGSEGSTNNGNGPKATYNDKDYRVPIVPYFETDVVVTGYDDITGNYIKNITYTIHGYRHYGSNLSASQNDNIVNDPQVAAKITQELMKNGYLRKRYEHRFTGLNTDVIRFDLDFNFAFSAVLPKVGGWRANIDSVAVHQKENEDRRKDNASYTSESNEFTADPTKLKNLSDAQLNQELTTLNSAIQSQQAIANAPANDTKYTQQDRNDANAVIARYLANRNTVGQEITVRRTNSILYHQKRRDEVENTPVKNTYAEDVVHQSNPFKITYSQQHGEAEQASGTGILGQWHRGTSLVGAMLNQLYAPITMALANISLEIRGDPYWLGYSGVERQGQLNGAPPPTKDTILPLIQEGDSTMALIFRFPSRIDPKTGAPIIRTDDFYSGLYRVRSVKHIFAEGQFKQTLDAFKLELIRPAFTPKENNTNNDTSNPSTDTTSFNRTS